MYLQKRNFNTNPQGLNTTKCVSARKVSADQSSHEVVQDISYYDTSSNSWKTFRKNYNAKAWGTKSNQVDFFESPTSSGPTMTYLVLYAEADCMVVKLLYRSTEKHRACEFFVKDAYFKNTEAHQCCNHMYEISCEPAVQILYQPEECSTLEQKKNG
ncbi:uncharacterized protein LOC125943629 [Dermacentor silvarum]|uniref:uncharacterized protein LOC125943629 n=1 Tax=Dermacentor silvarum TaxID=543639 RepID=UPI002100FE80|nr:uncharacterized protein LOC125943629 [Dermacentor silvarum]